MKKISKDSAITLFGTKITLSADSEFQTISGDDFVKNKSFRDAEAEDEKEDSNKYSSEAEDIQEEDDDTNLVSNTNHSHSMNPPETSSAETNVNLKAQSAETKSEQSGAAAGSHDKTPKKPDKIIPCPRCNSMDTKFCYYNNYNINQPRYFCKACQRYWTAGGTMRNVPVGAGRRKNKNSSASHYRHISISEALQVARIDSATNGKVLSFGLDTPISDTIFNLDENKGVNGTRNGFHQKHFEKKRIPGEIGDDCSSASSITVSNSMDEVGRRNCKPEDVMGLGGNMNGFPSPIPCLPGVPWPYQWNSAVPPPQAFCPPGFPMPFYPAPYWNCGIPGTWNVPLLSPQSSTSSNLKAPTSGPDSPTLGKHCREFDAQKTDDLEKEMPPKLKNGSVLAPKSLRIDDPSEAAKSSIWATLGIKNESLNGKGLFKAFQPKSDHKSHVAETSPVLRANPAALSRSLNFHESA